MGSVLIAALTMMTALGALVKAPMLCSHGERHQTFTATVTMPESVAAGAVFTVRIDSAPSNRISHLGLRYIHDMSTEYVLPDGATYVEGSGRLVPGTGTANALPDASVSLAGRTLRVTLPAHIENGGSYTPPSIEFALRADAPSGSDLELKFLRFVAFARAFLIGEVRTVCDPAPQPYVVGVTHVGSAASPQVSGVSAVAAPQSPGSPASSTQR